MKFIQYARKTANSSEFPYFDIVILSDSYVKYFCLYCTKNLNFVKTYTVRFGEEIVF